MRGQAETVSVVILVSIALIIALGLIYYFSPLLAKSSRSYRLASLLSTYAASLQVVELSQINSSIGVTEVLELNNLGTHSLRIYVGVLAFLNSSDIPVDVGGQYYNVYRLANGSAPLIYGNTSGWRLLPRINVAPGHAWVYVQIQDKYFRLSELGWNSSLVLYDVGPLNSSSPIALKIDVNVTQPAFTYFVSFFARVGNQYYEVSRIVVYQS